MKIVTIIWLIALSVLVCLFAFLVNEEAGLLAELSKTQLELQQRQFGIIKVEKELIRRQNEIMRILKLREISGVSVSKISQDE